MTKELEKYIRNNLESLIQSDGYPLLFFESISKQVFEIETSINFEKQSNLEAFSFFKDVRKQNIQTLRILNYKGELDNLELFWVEKILRFCEVRYRSLLVLGKQQGWDKNEIIEFYVLISSLFFEFFEKNKDYKYLNIGIKLLDLPWLKLPSNFPYPYCNVLYKRNLILEKNALIKIKNG